MIPRYDLVSEYRKSSGDDIYYMEESVDGDYIETSAYKNVIQQLQTSIDTRIERLKNDDMKSIRELYSDQRAIRELEKLKNYIEQITAC